MKKYQFGMVCAAMLMVWGCADSGAKRPKLDMKTKVVQARGALPLKLGEVLLPVRAPQDGVKFRKVPNLKSCHFPRASEEAKVVSITAYEGPNEYFGPLFFAAKVNDEDGTPIRTLSKSAGVVNVIVTETQRPVYLSLASYDPVLWRIHTAPDVKLDGVSVISHEPSGLMVAGLAPARIGFYIYSEGDTTKRRKAYNMRRVSCWKSPERYSNAKAHWEAPAGNGYVRTREDMQKYKAEEKAYKSWLTWQRRRIGHLNVDMSAYRVEAALVGPAPIPGQQITPTPLSGPVYIANNGYEAFWGTRETAYAQYPLSDERWARR
ncbi:MAG TPA: hypothetical protein ENJ46_04285 [Hellea balneolensis]|uniref:Uncharacterized protein n=1 Tax=Hellea balneolensis TaxID=287478 RepID=A0A7C3C1I3_9PROT|nr:hypothetical protein [Hellea balneolensis]